jgi:hypothetical protein
MEPRDDYQDEMDMLSPDEIDGLLSGRAPANPAGARLAGLVVDLRRNLLPMSPALTWRRWSPPPGTSCPKRGGPGCAC